MLELPAMFYPPMIRLGPFSTLPRVDGRVFPTVRTIPYQKELTMSKMCMALLVAVAVLLVSSPGFAAQPIGTFGDDYPTGNVYPVQVPAGLRFGVVSEATVRTGAVDGVGYGGAGVPTGYGGAPCDTCCAGGICMDWKLLPWYGCWDDHHHHGCRSCRAGCRP